MAKNEEARSQRRSSLNPASADQIACPAKMYVPTAIFKLVLNHHKGRSYNHRH